MKTTYIATCRDWPQGNADLQALVAALDATLTPWQDINPAKARCNAGISTNATCANWQRKALP